MPADCLEVDDLFRIASGAITSSLPRGTLVQGEVLSCHRHAASGHLYFDLSDCKGRGSVLPCAMWRSTCEAGHSGSDLITLGSTVVVCAAKTTLYSKKASLTLHVRKVQSCVVGEGQRKRERDALIQRLTEAGTISRERRPLPRFCRIGVVTSIGSAAHADMQSGVDQRWPGYDVVYEHAAMQGTEAPASICAAIATLVASGCGIVVCARGGGSEDDLSAFDDGRVVDAVLSCPVPTVVAVGHESDTSVADLVCDHRSKTPTAAMEHLLPLKMEEVSRVAARIEEVREAAQGVLERAGSALKRAASESDAVCQVATTRQRLSVHQLANRLEETVARRCESLRGLMRRAKWDLAHAAGAQLETRERRRKDLDARLRSAVEESLRGAAGVMQRLQHSVQLYESTEQVVVLQDGVRKRRRSEIDPTRSLRIVFSDGYMDVGVGETVAERCARYAR